MMRDNLQEQCRTGLIAPPGKNGAIPRRHTRLSRQNTVRKNVDGIIKIPEVGGQTTGTVKVRGTTDEMFSFRRPRERKGRGCNGTTCARSVATTVFAKLF